MVQGLNSIPVSHGLPTTLSVMSHEQRKCYTMSFAITMETGHLGIYASVRSDTQLQWQSSPGVTLTRPQKSWVRCRPPRDSQMPGPNFWSFLFSCPEGGSSHQPQSQPPPQPSRPVLSPRVCASLWVTSTSSPSQSHGPWPLCFGGASWLTDSGARRPENKWVLPETQACIQVVCAEAGLCAGHREEGPWAGDCPRESVSGAGPTFGLHVTVNTQLNWKCKKWVHTVVALDCI